MTYAIERGNKKIVDVLINSNRIIISPEERNMIKELEIELKH